MENVHDFEQFAALSELARLRIREPALKTSRGEIWK